MFFCKKITGGSIWLVSFIYVYFWVVFHLLLTYFILSICRVLLPLKVAGVSHGDTMDSSSIQLTEWAHLRLFFGSFYMLPGSLVFFFLCLVTFQLSIAFLLPVWPALCPNILSTSCFVFVCKYLYCLFSCVFCFLCYNGLFSVCCSFLAIFLLPALMF